MFGGLLRRITLVGALAAAVALGAPLAAQTYSDGFLFLKAVEDKDIDKADELLGKPGSVLMRVLLGAGADADRTDNSGRSARDYAELEGRDSLVLAEITRNDEKGGQRRADASVYGPSF